jgi:hypothetical protein
MDEESVFAAAPGRAISWPAGRTASGAGLARQQFADIERDQTRAIGGHR